MCSTTHSQQPPQWAILTASVNMRLWDSSSIIIHVIQGRPVGLFQSYNENAVRIFLASAPSSNHVICPRETSFLDSWSKKRLTTGIRLYQTNQGNWRISMWSSILCSSVAVSSVSAVLFLRHGWHSRSSWMSHYTNRMTDWLIGWLFFQRNFSGFIFRRPEFQIL